ncbi:hypothetical protein [Acinetobacter bereziniae]|uniref:hypothetical protein n=1 Tax=Acinetobacter bereziniae TaxID=106648 RepID=UPI0019008C22|nr:hypothetical protein [Acinetobacter bereziniae]MBJ8442768.1 hypothetical protein [Acinetobacter bereziniae]
MIDNLIDFIAIIFGVFLTFLHSFIIGLYMPYLNFYINIILLFVYIFSSIRGNKKLFYFVSFLFVFIIWIPFCYHDSRFGFGYLYSKIFFKEMKEGWIYLLSASLITIFGLFLIEFNFKNLFARKH